MSLKVSVTVFPPLWEATTANLAIVRLHGRNRETWQKKGLASSAERFKYLYSGEELQTLGAAIRGLKAKVKQLHVVFNNNYRDYAQRNAAELNNLLVTVYFYSSVTDLWNAYSGVVSMI